MKPKSVCRCGRPVWTEKEDLLRLMMSTEGGFTMEQVVCPGVRGGVLEITLPAISAMLLKAVPRSDS